MNLENCSTSCRYSSIANYIRSLVNSIANALLLITWTNNKFGHTLVSNTYGAFEKKMDQIVLKPYLWQYRCIKQNLIAKDSNVMNGLKSGQI